MNIYGFKCTMKQAREFFGTREPLIGKAANLPEMQKRIEWLSQGILKFGLGIQPSGYWLSSQCEAEKALFQEFKKSNG